MPGLKVILVILVKGSPDITRSGHQGSVVHCCIRILFSEAPLRILGCQSYNMLQPPIKNIHLRLFNEMHICFLIVVESQDNIHGIAHIHHWDVDHLLHKLGFIHMLYISYIYNCWKSPNSHHLYNYGFMDVIITPIVRLSVYHWKIFLMIHKQHKNYIENHKNTPQSIKKTGYNIKCTYKCHFTSSVWLY